MANMAKRTIKFKSLGHEASAQGWKVKVFPGGEALLISDGNGAFLYDEDPWTQSYSASELRDLAELLIGAADLLEPVAPVGTIGGALTEERLDELPFGTRVLDGDGDEWVKRSDGMWGYLRMSTTALQGHTSKDIMQWGDVRCVQ